jgi:hypothetical protein
VVLITFTWNCFTNSLKLGVVPREAQITVGIRITCMIGNIVAYLCLPRCPNRNPHTAAEKNSIRSLRRARWTRQRNVMTCQELTSQSTVDPSWQTRANDLVSNGHHRVVKVCRLPKLLHTNSPNSRSGFLLLSSSSFNVAQLKFQCHRQSLPIVYALSLQCYHVPLVCYLWFSNRAVSQEISSVNCQIPA